MATRNQRIAEFITDAEPQPGFEVELLCQDHVGTYVLPFPCRRGEGVWINTKTGGELAVDILGWRPWDEAPSVRMK